MYIWNERFYNKVNFSQYFRRGGSIQKTDALFVYIRAWCASNNGNVTNFAKVSTESNAKNLPSLNSSWGSAYYLTKFNIWPTLTIFDIPPNLIIFDIYIISKKDLSNIIKSLLILCNWLIDPLLSAPCREIPPQQGPAKSA